MTLDGLLKTHDHDGGVGFKTAASLHRVRVANAIREETQRGMRMHARVREREEGVGQAGESWLHDRTYAAPPDVSTKCKLRLIKVRDVLQD